MTKLYLEQKLRWHVWPGVKTEKIAKNHCGGVCMARYCGRSIKTVCNLEFIIKHKKSVRMVKKRTRKYVLNRKNTIFLHDICIFRTKIQRKMKLKRLWRRVVYFFPHFSYVFCKEQQWRACVPSFMNTVCLDQKLWWHVWPVTKQKNEIKVTVEEFTQQGIVGNCPGLFFYDQDFHI